MSSGGCHEDGAEEYEEREEDAEVFSDACVR